MTDLDARVPALWADVVRRLEALEATQQLSASTVGDTDEDAVAVDEVVADASIVNDALPDMQDAVASANDGVSQLDARLAAADAELDARLELADTNLAEAREELEEAQGQIRDAFGQEIEGLSDRIDQIVVGADGVLLLYSDEAPTADDKAPAGSTWWMINESKGIVGQWQQVGTDDAPVWEPRPIESDLIANLDVGKLSAGQAAIAQVVAQKIAASTASIQTVNVGNLFVTQGATMPQAVIDYLFANVVTAKKITTDMLDVNTFNGVTLTGTRIKTSASGQRLELLGTRMDAYSANGTKPAASITATDEQGASFASLTITNAYTATTGIADFTVPRNPFAGTYESSRRCNLTLSHGVNAPVVQMKTLISDYTAIQADPIIDATGQNVTFTGKKLKWMPAGSGAPIEVLGLGGPNRDQNLPRLTAGELYYTYNGAPAVEYPVMIKDPDPYNGGGADVIFMARDYRTRDGSSIVSGLLRLNIPPTTGTAGQLLSTGAVTRLGNMTVHSDSQRTYPWLVSTGSGATVGPGVYLVTTNFVTTTRVSSRTFLSIFRDGTEIQRAPGSSEDQFSGVATIAVAAGTTAAIDMRFYQASGGNMYAQRGDLNITKIG